MRFLIQNKSRKGSSSPVEWVIAIIIGILMVSSIPFLATFFTQLFGMIVAIIGLGIVVGLIILAVWFFFFMEQGGSRY